MPDKIEGFHRSLYEETNSSIPAVQESMEDVVQIPSEVHFRESRLVKNGQSFEHLAVILRSEVREGNNPVIDQLLQFLVNDRPDRRESNDKEDVRWYLINVWSGTYP